MALSSTGNLLPISEELHNQLTSADRDPSLRLPINPTLQTILLCLSCETCNFGHIISYTQDLDRPLPFSRTTANEIWFKTIIEAWEEWKLYEASRLLWHIPNVQAVHNTRRTATVGWDLAWDAVKTGMRDIWSTETEKYIRKLKEDCEAKCGRQGGRIQFEYDITPPNLHRIMPPADCDLSRHRNIYNGKDIGFYTHVDYYNRLVAHAEDAEAHDFYGEIATLSSALANNPEMELPREVYDESKLMYHETRSDANMRREMQIRNREEMMMETMMCLKAKSTDKGSNSGEDVSMREVAHDTNGNTAMGETFAGAIAFREVKWTVYKAEKQKDEMMSRPEVQRTDSRRNSGNHAVHNMWRKSMPAQKGKARNDPEAKQMDEDPFTNMDVNTQPQDTSIIQGLSRAEKKRLKNEQRAEEKRQNKAEMEKARECAREEALARKMDSALNGLEVMQLDEDPFIDAPTEQNPTRNEKARNAQAKAEKEVRRADREIERANEHQRVRDEALALEMENALDDLEVMGLEDDMTSPQKKRLQARQLKKVEMERLPTPERPRKKTKKSKAKKERKQRAAAEYHYGPGEYQAGGLMYDDSAEGEAARREAAEREEARLEEVMKRNIEEIRRMCFDEGEKQSGEVVMDLETGKTLGNKRERSESL